MHLYLIFRNFVLLSLFINQSISYNKPLNPFLDSECKLDSKKATLSKNKFNIKQVS